MVIIVPLRVFGIIAPQQYVLIMVGTGVVSAIIYLYIAYADYVDTKRVFEGSSRVIHGWKRAFVNLQLCSGLMTIK